MDLLSLNKEVAITLELSSFKRMARKDEGRINLLEDYL